ncbi:GroES-like protein [Leucogyrophana mollusca]|uniref:GroES-like protein n=1 Tax=Leucogyrophana mollusca TaxID=85980 RepID=A0ACB8BWS3_9AGAM|nr:GroES-like protein [Leucogyrophana mollusca]
MTTQIALWLDNGKFTIGPKDIEHPGPGEVLIRNVAAGLNPIDWKIRDHGFFMVKEYPAVIGEEGAGVVEEIGVGVTNLIKGDKVFYQSFMTNRCTTFQQFSIIPADLAGKVPDVITLEQAASISIGIAPAALAFYGQRPQGFEYLPPWEDGGKDKYSRQPIIIMGGASSLGQYAIQLARLSGFSPIIATASPHNTDLLTSLGATHIIDRKLPIATFQEEVRKITSTPVELAFDTVSYPETQQALYDVLAPEGKMVVSTPPVVATKADDKKTILFVNGTFFLPENKKFGSRFMSALTRMIAEGEIKTPAIEVIPNGLNGVALGLERLKNNAVSGKKLVVRPWET